MASKFKSISVECLADSVGRRPLAAPCSRLAPKSRQLTRYDSRELSKRFEKRIKRCSDIYQADISYLLFVSRSRTNIHRVGPWNC